jgi:hypothetical protein
MEHDQTQDENKMDQSTVESPSRPNDIGGVHVQGHIKIHDPESGEVFIDKRNAIHYENMSEAIAYNLANKGQGFIYRMHFGNGGTTVNETGVITYNPANTNAQNSSLYNPTYSKIVDDTSVSNTDPLRNKIEIRHTPGNPYTDILVTCLLDYGEPTDQAVFDTTQDLSGSYVFDELGLVAKSIDGTDDDNVGIGSTGKLLTHVVFHPVQKSLNRLIQIDYTVRIQTLTNLSAIG